MEEWIIKLMMTTMVRYVKHEYITMIDMIKTYWNIFIDKTPISMELYGLFDNTRIFYHRNWI